MNSYFFEIIDRLIDDLPDHLKDPNNPLEIDLVLDGGAFNGSFLTGALFFLKEMEKRNFIKIKRISGCSIGSCVGFLYLIDCLDLNITLYNDVIQHFKKNYNLYKKKAIEASTYLKQFSIETAAEYFKKIISPEFVLIGTDDKFINNGIMTSSEEFANKLLNIKNMNFR